MSTPFPFEADMDNIDLVRKVFPNGTSTRWNEVNGLSFDEIKNLRHNPDAILIHMVRNYSKFLRNQYHFIVLVDDHYIYGRLCDAAPESGYDMYAALFDVVPCSNIGWLHDKLKTLDMVFSNARID